MKQVNIFLGGGVALLEGDQQQCGYRPTVIDPVISKLNSRRNAKRFYVVKTYADLVTEYIPNGQQEHYNEFVREKADIAIFIFDGNIGNKTKEEIENACNSFDKRKHPTVFFYGINLKDHDEVVKYLNSKKQYFRHFSNKEELQRIISDQLAQWHPYTNFCIFKKGYIVGTKFFITLFILLVSFILVLLFVKIPNPNRNKMPPNVKVEAFLSRYKDFGDIFSDELLSYYNYEDSIDNESRYHIYPNCTLPYKFYHYPILSIRLVNKENMTFVFNKCFFDIIKWEKDSCAICKNTGSKLSINDTISVVLKIPVLNIDNKSNQSYQLNDFDCTLVRGETDTNFKFALNSYENGTFEARLRVISTSGDTICSPSLIISTFRPYGALLYPIYKNP